MGIKFDEYCEELRQIAFDYAMTHPELLDDFQHFWCRFSAEFFMADGHEQYAWEGYAVALSRSRER